MYIINTCRYIESRCSIGYVSTYMCFRANCYNFKLAAQFDILFLNMTLSKKSSHGNIHSCTTT